MTEIKCLCGRLRTCCGVENQGVAVSCPEWVKYLHKEPEESMGLAGFHPDGGSLPAHGGRSWALLAVRSFPPGIR